MFSNIIQKVPIEISARHIHLSPKDLALLFGGDYKLNFSRALSQVGQFAAEEMVTAVGAKGKITNLRVIGPVRAETQVEMSKTDYRILGIEAPVRISGDLKGSAPIKLFGPNGRIELRQGAIVAKRHLHLEGRLARKWGLKNDSKISIKIEGPRSLMFNEVVVRSSSPSDKLSFQVDTDEANAAGLLRDDEGVLLL